MKNLVIYIIAFMLCSPVLLGTDDTRYTLSGRVTDSEGIALPGATVLLEDTFLGTSTGPDGRYRLDGIREGDYKIRISFVGYGSLTESITVDGDMVANFSLSTSTVVADEIVVRGSRAGRNTPVTYTTISGETLGKVNLAQDMPYILSMVPSLVETSESGAGVGYTNFRIRGSDPNRINVTIDGIPLNDAESQQVFWVDLPDLAGSISDIQVQRGVGTSTNGAGAFGASVNLMTDNPSAVPYAEFSTVYGSYSTVKGSAKIGTGLLGEKFMMDLRISGLHSDGYVDRSSSNHSSIFATGVYKLSKGRFKVNFAHGREITGISWWGVPYDSLATNRTFNPAGMYVNEDGDTAFYHNQVDDYTQTHFHGIFNWQFSTNLHLNVAGHFTRGLGYYEQYKEDQYLADYGLPEVRIEGFFPVFITQTDLVRRKWMYNYFEGLLFNLHYNKGRTEFTLGGGANRYLGDHFGRIVWMRIAGKTEKDYRWYLNGSTKDEINIYGKLNYNLGSGITLLVICNTGL
ncbi:MAG: TonB-dependent receptor [Bacteroidales bacterium]